VATRNGAG